MFGWLVAIQVVAMTLPVIGASAYFPLDTYFVVFLVAYIGALSASVALYVDRVRVGWFFGVWVLAFFAFPLPALMVPASVLAARGVTVDATVIAERKEYGKGRDRVLTLADEEGRRIPHHVAEHEGYPVGSRIAVVVDPEGLFHPTSVEDLMEDGEPSPWLWTVSLPFAAALFALTWMATKPEPPEPSYVVPPPPPPRRPRRRRRKTRSQ